MGWVILCVCGCVCWASCFVTAYLPSRILRSSRSKTNEIQDLHGKELEPLEEEEEEGGRRRRKGGKGERDIVSIAEQLAREEANWKKGKIVVCVVVLVWVGDWGAERVCVYVVGEKEGCVCMSHSSAS